MASYDEAIPPGQVGKVTATVKTEHYRGEVQKGITVATSDPENPNVQLRIKMRVVGSIVVLPRPGLVLTGAADQGSSGKLLVRKDGSETGELDVTDITTSAPWLAAKARKVEAPEPAAAGLPAALPGDYILDVSIENDAPSAYGRQQVKFKTGLAREPEVQIPVSVPRQEPIRVVPRVLRLRQPAAGEEASGVATVFLRSNAASNDKDALKATASPDQFRVKVEPDGERRYKAIVTWKPDVENAPKRGTVVLTKGADRVMVTVQVEDGRAGANLPMRGPAKGGPTAQ